MLCKKVIKSYIQYLTNNIGLTKLFNDLKNEDKILKIFFIKKFKAHILNFSKH